MSSLNQVLPLVSEPERQSTLRSRWNAWSAALGGAIWLVCVAAGAIGRMRLGWAEGLFLLAPLVTIPLGLRIVLGTKGQGIALFRLTLVVQTFGALLAAAAFAFPAGHRAGALATGWLAATACIGLCGLVGIVRGNAPLFDRICLNVGLVYLPFGGCWFVASRLGLNPAGFKEPIVFLTAVHFHYAAFAAPLLAGMAGVALRSATGSRPRLFSAAAAGVIIAPALLAAGWALGSPLLKVTAALVLSVGLVVVAGLTFLVIPHFRNALAGALLVISGLAVCCGMCLVCLYAGGEFLGARLITIPQMTVSHGVLNCLGFTLCGLLAWNVEQR
jgi:hypothetical protein